MDHYERLGVKKDATDDELKRAYRQKAREHHPDKGGSHDECAQITNAYQVLKDPQRRLLYDATGKESQLPLEKEIEGCLLSLFSGALAQPGDIPIVDNVRKSIEAGLASFSINKVKLRERKKKLKSKRHKIKSTSVNLVHMLIDQEIHDIKAQLIKIDRDEQVGKGALKVLESYSEDYTLPPKPMNNFKLIFDETYRSTSIEDLLGGKL